jgi:hypothetical protein
MGIPGFTAEAADYRTGRIYRTRGRTIAITGQVVPQQRYLNRLPTDGGDADPCRGACRCCAWYQYQGCCNLCDDCFTRH